MTLFVDSSVWYAIVDRGDTEHKAAVRVLSRSEALVTSDHVLVETWTLICARIGRSIAERFWDSVRSGLAAVETVTVTDLDAAWRIGQIFPDQDFSIVDRTSFALLERAGLTRVASFDQHFAIYRYGRDRRRAFEVVR